MIKFFLPESDDLVDPGYDFERDVYSTEPSSARQDVYAHEIFDQPSFDGLLVSKSNIGRELEEKVIAKGGIHKHLRLPEIFPILGDCGAFQFIGDHNPPYNSEQIFDYYNDLGFDYGITLDHVIVEFDPAFDQVESQGQIRPVGDVQFRFSFDAQEGKNDDDYPRPTEDMQYRFRLTLDNAREMLQLVQERGAKF